MGKIYERVTFSKRIENKLASMEIGDEFNKVEFISELYDGDYDIYRARSFDVMLCNAKKKFPNKEFDSHKRTIKRLK